VEPYSAQKLHSFVIALLQILDLLFAGSQVATISVTLHTYYINFIENFLFIHNSITALIFTAVSHHGSVMP